MELKRESLAERGEVLPDLQQLGARRVAVDFEDVLERACCELQAGQVEVLGGGDQPDGCLDGVRFAVTALRGA